MTKERRLGRGLEALLGRPAEPVTASQLSLIGADDGVDSDLGVRNSEAGGLTQISVYEIDSNPFQPRREFDAAEIAGLAESIREHGLIQPIVVRRQGSRHQLISGERRLRAAIKAGWSEVPAQVRDADDRQVAEIAIVENLQRKDLNALEKAVSFQQYLMQYGCTQEELASRLHVDRSTVANLIRLLELPDAVQQAVRTGAITQGHARALLTLGDEREQIAFCTRIQAEGLSVRAVEELVQDAVRQADAESPAAAAAADQRRGKGRATSKHLSSLEQELRASLGTKVDLRQAAKGRGRIVVHFSSHEEFERLMAQFTGQRGSRRQVG